MSGVVTLTPLRQQSLDDLWVEAETLGNVRVYTHSAGWSQSGQRNGYSVEITGKKRNTELKVERRHTALVCAMADAINEAREMGLGSAE